MARTGIALGSNLGDRATNLRAALDGLRSISVPHSPLLIAPLFETIPVGCPDGSPTFLNSVVEIEWQGSALSLLAQTRALEAKLGRIPNTVRNAPRVIDIDILYCGNVTVDSLHLTLPHPRMMERLFVLMPLASVRPDFRPRSGGPSIKRILADFSSNESYPIRVEAECWPATDR